MEDTGAIVVDTLPLAAGQWIPAHRHPVHQLNWACRGVLGIAVGDRYWVLPPSRAIFLPAGVSHRTGATRDAVLRSLYLEPSRCALDWTEPTPVAVPGLLASLVEYLDGPAVTGAARARAEAVLVDVLHPLPATPITVPELTDDRARAVADRLLRDPGDRSSLDRLAGQAGASRRTLSRVWAAEAGMSFNQWRTQVRLRAAVSLLADGQPVATVARRVGYATPGAFLAAFRRVVGATPGQYLRLAPDARRGATPNE